LYHYMKSKKFDYIKEKVCESIWRWLV
jgi:hypothetical protein